MIICKEEGKDDGGGKDRVRGVYRNTRPQMKIKGATE